MKFKKCILFLLVNIIYVSNALGNIAPSFELKYLYEKVPIIAKITVSIYHIENSADALPLVLVFFILSPIFYFLTALLGGFDNNTLNEFKASLELNFVTRMMGGIAYKPALLGSYLSPWHGKFPLRNWGEANIEAKSLTKEKMAF